MNIFYLGYSLQENSGGIENYTFTILNYLKSQGHNVIVYTLNGKNETFENIELKRRRFVDRFFLSRRITKILHKKHPQIDCFLCGHLFLSKNMEKIVSKYHKNYNLFVYGIDCWAGRFKNYSPHLKHLNKIISISSFTTKQIKNQGFKGEILYLPPVLDQNKFSEILRVKKSQAKITFLTVGRLSSNEQYKGHDKVIEAVKVLVEQGVKNFEYRIVGKGDDKVRFLNKVQELGLKEYVRFYGFVDDDELKNIYNDSDVFIMPSNVSLDPNKPEGEGFGIVFTEAAMYSLPLIGPDRGGSTDIIENEINGLECNPLDPRDISKKMKVLIDDEEKRIEFGKKAKEKTLKNFTLNQLDFYIKNLLNQ
jgi:glycosyltransferase involved in cell wall biosynthesis